MRVVLKNLMRRNPTIFNPPWAFLYPLIYRCDVKYFGSEYLNGPQAFEMIFEENRWGSSQSRSGRGSTVAYTKRLRPLLERYKRYSFQTIGIEEGPLPNADLWLCRDAAAIPYIFTTTYNFFRKNDEAKAVGFRFINLRLPPFILSPPLSMVPDFVAPEPPPPRYVGLWSREQVAVVQFNSSLSSSL
jgi:hypothetical protein